MNPHTDSGPSAPAGAGSLAVPHDSTDCHVHVFGNPHRFPFAPDRTYTPPAATLDALKALHARTGVRRIVVVQPSVYGFDNGCSAQAIAEWGPDARGVAVVAQDAGAQELLRLDRAGFRGVRLNLAVRAGADVESAWAQMAGMSRTLTSTGWHIQLAVDPGLIPTLAQRLGELPQPIVFDHFAYARAGSSGAGFASVLELVRSGRAYVKLSAPHRGSARPEGDWSDMGALAQLLAAANPDRLLWGSDWPHPSSSRSSRDDVGEVSPFHAVDDMSLLPRLADWLGSPDLLRRVLVANPARLYGF